MRVNLDRAEFKERARSGNVVPVYADMVADTITPVGAYAALGGGYRFLLESAEHTDHVGRYSFVGCDPEVLIEAAGRQITVSGPAGPRVYTVEGDPLDELKSLMAAYQFSGDLPEGGPWFCGGAVGYLGYGMVSFFEPTVPVTQGDTLGLPDMMFMVASTLLVFDHKRRRLRILSNAIIREDGPDAAYDRAVKSIQEVLVRLRKPVHFQPIPIAGEESLPEEAIGSNTTRAEYLAMVERVQEYIRAGDIFQIVPSQRFETAYAGDPLTLYRCLRFVNPSPYMFCLEFGGRFSVVGSSPEVHVRAIDGLVEIRPIAGTRRRGATEAEDKANEADLLADPKERAEHIMLVDLARNDVGRIAEYNSVRVTDLMVVERYSHVMHIVSNVVGRLRPGRDAYDVMRATFPAGTVSGSPKIRAMQILSEVEKSQRGIYAGAVGYFGFDGNLDSCITLRTVALVDGKAYVQAGGGVVADSTPEGEYQETVNKAMGMMKAIALARAVSSAAAESPQAGSSPCNQEVMP